MSVPTYCSKAEFAKAIGVTRAAVTKWATAGRIAVTPEGEVDIARSVAMLEKNRDTTRPINRGKSAAAKAAAAGVSASTAVVNAATAPDPTAELEQLEDETTAEYAARLADATADESFNASKARNTRYAGLLKQLEYDTKSGMVVLASEVAAVFGAELAAVRTRLLAIPAEKASRLVLLKTAQELQDALLEVITDALSAVAHRD